MASDVLALGVYTIGERTHVILKALSPERAEVIEKALQLEGLKNVIVEPELSSVEFETPFCRAEVQHALQILRKLGHAPVESEEDIENALRCARARTAKSR